MRASIDSGSLLSIVLRVVVKVRPPILSLIQSPFNLLEKDILNILNVNQCSKTILNTNFGNKSMDDINTNVRSRRRSPTGINAN